MASGFVGLYMRAKEMKERVEVGREVLGSPCWRQLQNPSLYIVRANDGGWVCQGEDAISTAAGFLRLRDSTCHLPSDLTAIGWLVHTRWEQSELGGGEGLEVPSCGCNGGGRGEERVSTSAGLPPVWQQQW